MEEIMRDTSQMPWEPLSRFPGKAEVKELRGESMGGGSTMLVRLPAGGHVAPHCHPGVVQLYVLEGEYDSRGRRFTVGAYRLLPGHAEVARISSKAGATLLIVYDPILEE